MKPPPPCPPDSIFNASISGFIRVESSRSTDSSTIIDARRVVGLRAVSANGDVARCAVIRATSLQPRALPDVWKSTVRQYLLAPERDGRFGHSLNGSTDIPAVMN